MLDNKGHPNRLGIWGWLGGGRWGFERYLYTLHRLTGLGLLLYFLLHIFVTSSRAFGPEAWAASMGRVSGPLFIVGEFLVFAAFAFHACNGVRLVLVELGLAIGKPDRAGLPVPDVGARTAAARHRRHGPRRPRRSLRAASTSCPPVALRSDHARSTTLDVAPAGRRRDPGVPRPPHDDHAPRRARRDLQPGRREADRLGERASRGPRWASSW